MEEEGKQGSTMADIDDQKITSPIKAIRARCLDCCAGSAHEVKLCPVTDCSLYAFRFGKNPYIKRTMTEEQRKASAERLKAFKESKNRK